MNKRSGTVVYLPIRKSKIMVVDLEDYELATSVDWYAYKDRNTYYAKKGCYSNGKPNTRLLHREVIGAKKGKIVDHINHDGLDNRRCNLRIVTRYQNSTHTSIKRKGLSKYRGVMWNKQCRKWMARITSHGITRHLGVFATEKDAAYAYDAAAKKYHGEFAAPNFPEEYKIALEKFLNEDNYEK